MGRNALGCSDELGKANCYQVHHVKACRNVPEMQCVLRDEKFCFSVGRVASGKWWVGVARQRFVGARGEGVGRGWATLG